MWTDGPPWWYAERPGVMPGVLAPLALVWGTIAEQRMRRAQPYRACLPVICAGNFTAGGTGKTPFSLHIAHLLAARGEAAVFLTRGHGGRHVAPHRVNPAADTSRDVGDEALLLARQNQTLVARDRGAGAQVIEMSSSASRPTVIVMDDGLQNPGLAKDLSLAIVDGRRGLGNGHVIPAGPLRAPLAFQLGLVDAIVVNRQLDSRDTPSDVAEMLRKRFEGPVLEAWVEPDTDAAKLLSGMCVLALSGIANPGRFHALLERIGAKVADRIAFPDHHAFTERDATAILARASQLGARIVTTEKDWVRLIGQAGALAELREKAKTVPITLRLSQSDAAQLEKLIAGSLERRRAQ